MALYVKCRQLPHYKSKDPHDTPLSPSVVRVVNPLPGLQEAVAERFDRLLELRLAEVEDVGKGR